MTGEENPEQDDKDKEFHDWNEKKRREEFEEHKRKQSQTGSSGDDGRITALENEVKEHRSILSGAGLTKENLDKKKEDATKEDDEFFPSIADCFGGD